MTPPPLWLAILRAARADARLRGEDLRVLLVAAEIGEDGAPCDLPAWYVASRAAMHPANVSRPLRRLVAAGYLVPHQPTGRYSVCVPTAAARARALVTADERPARSA